MINTTLGEKLRELRKINGYTQDYVASYNTGSAAANH